MAQGNSTEMRNMIRNPEQRKLVLWGMIKDAIHHIAREQFSEEELEEKPILPFVEYLITMNRPQDDDDANRLIAWVGKGEAGHIATLAALAHACSSWQDGRSKQCPTCANKSEAERLMRVCAACGDTRLNTGSDQRIADIFGITRAVWLKEHRPWYLQCLTRVAVLYEASEKIGTYMPEEVKKDDEETARKQGAG